MAAQLAKVQESINPAQQVLRRNVIVEIERVEQRLLPRPFDATSSPRLPGERLALSIATKRSISSAGQRAEIETLSFIWPNALGGIDS